MSLDSFPLGDYLDSRAYIRAPSSLRATVLTPNRRTYESRGKGGVIPFLDTGWSPESTTKAKLPLQNRPEVFNENFYLKINICSKLYSRVYFGQQ